jgi:methyl-accepting chemotaxis protein
VVANEIKNLSAGTANATREISTIIGSIQREIHEATVSINDGQATVEVGVVKSHSARQQLEKILRLASESNDMISHIATATEEQSATTSEISTMIHRVSETAGDVTGQMEHTARIFGELSETAERIYSTVGRFSVGNDHDTIKGYATELRDKVTAALERAMADGTVTLSALFSEEYRPIPNTCPQKFTTLTDKLFDSIISPLQEQIIARDERIFYALCVDSRGYCPSHNLRYSKPLTGNPEIDKDNNRTKRMFNDRKGLRAATGTNRFLLQTYLRDTGELMNDLSTPIILGGRHWGAIRIGYRADD